MNGREISIAASLLTMAIVLGVLPNSLFSVMEKSTADLVDTMQDGYDKALDDIDKAASTASKSSDNVELLQAMK
jgi:archaellum component FlaG (FlaF/FlaG flagellin family)